MIKGNALGGHLYLPGHRAKALGGSEPTHSSTSSKPLLRHLSSQNEGKLEEASSFHPGMGLQSPPHCACPPGRREDAGTSRCLKTIALRRFHVQ